MNHDPLCPTEQCCSRDERATRNLCACGLIREVRADQTQRMLGELAAGRNQGAHDDDWILNGIRQRVREDTLDQAGDAVRQPIYDAMVDDEYWCDQPCCEFSEQRESEFSKFHNRVADAAVAAINALRRRS